MHSKFNPNNLNGEKIITKEFETNNKRIGEIDLRIFNLYKSNQGSQVVSVSSKKTISIFKTEDLSLIRIK